MEFFMPELIKAFITSGKKDEGYTQSELQEKLF